VVFFFFFLRHIFFLIKLAETSRDPGETVKDIIKPGEDRR